MRRPLWKIFAALSLLMCVAMSALMICSYLAKDEILFWMEKRVLQLTQDRGRLKFAWAVIQVRPPSLQTAPVFAGIPYQYRFLPLSQPTWEWRRQWFGFQNWASRGVVLYIPFWFLVLLTAVSPATWLFLQRRAVRSRKLANLCPTCGYDLRATPDPVPNAAHHPRTRKPLPFFSQFSSSLAD